MLVRLVSQSASLSSLLPFAVPAFYKLFTRASAVAGVGNAEIATPSTSRDQINATINGRLVRVPEGTSILDAARELKIHVRHHTCLKMAFTRLTAVTGTNAMHAPSSRCTGKQASWNMPPVLGGYRRWASAAGLRDVVGAWHASADR